MSEVSVLENVLKGGEFIIRESGIEEVFIPEEMNEEQQMIRSTVDDFVKNEIYSRIPEIEKQKDNIGGRLLEMAGELGLLGSHMPEEYGGMNLDTNTNTLICEAVGKSGSFTTTFAAHTGIGMLPIFYYGTAEQKDKFLPKLATGELKAAYCLTEPGSGSDALAAKTKAVLTEDGKHYILNGQKMWISNAGFADVFVVFAQIDGDKFTGFIVEKGTEGMSLGAEEDKLGIKGSSTRQVFFENAKVPAENVLGEIGKGHLIAFNVLNIGRFKLGALVLGAGKESSSVAIKYANERKQFDTPIGQFGAIKYKLAEQAIRNFVLESAQYRVSNLIQLKINSLKEQNVSPEQAKLQAAEEYAIECAMLKVYGSEVLDYTVDETLQIHGGIGFSEEYAAARSYRDSRICRIYEGTNEINRLLSVDMLLKRAMKGKLDIITPAWEVQKELAAMPSFEKAEGPFAEEETTLKNLKKALLVVAGGAAKMQQDGELNLKHEQEILMNIADVMIHIFNAESLLLRTKKLATMKSEDEMKLYQAILKTYFTEATSSIDKWCKEAVMSYAEDDLLRILLMGIKRFVKYAPVNVKNLRRTVADHLLAANEYAL